MLSDGCTTFEYDSANRLLKAGGHTYTYNAEDIRIRNLCGDADTTYTYNTNCKLSQLLTKTTNGITTKYVYGNGLIGEEKCGEFKTYHFDFRGSTVAITDINGNITDTFKYDTYGNVTEHIGDSFVIFGYNGRDGVITDKNGLIYMRARYYSPAMRRFINADIIHGQISNSTSLNRYAYVNGNPVSFVDPFGLEKERGSSSSANINLKNIWEEIKDFEFVSKLMHFFINEKNLALFDELIKKVIKTSEKPNEIARGYWEKIVAEELDFIDGIIGGASVSSKVLKVTDVTYNIFSGFLSAGSNALENYINGVAGWRITTDAAVDVVYNFTTGAVSDKVGKLSAAGAAVLSLNPELIILAGISGNIATEGLLMGIFEGWKIKEEKSILDWTKEGADWLLDEIRE